MPTNAIVASRLPPDRVGDAAQAVSAEGLPGLRQVAEIKFMRRVQCVFETPAAAAAALPRIEECLACIPGCEEARAGFSYSNVATAQQQQQQQQFLSLPSTGKLYFVSPPPSPPNEWVDQLEEEPNKRTHHDEQFNAQLAAALARIDAGGSVPIPHSSSGPAILVTDCGRQ